MKDILNWWTFTPTVILKRWYICWWIRHLMTLFLHTKDFHYPKKMKMCLFTRAGERMCLQSEEPWLEKSPAICLRPSLLRLHSELFPARFYILRGDSGGEESHDHLSKAWQFLFSTPQCHPQKMVRCTASQNIKHTAQMPCILRTEDFYGQIFKSIWKLLSDTT